MERVKKQNGESETSTRTAQAKFTSKSREGDFVRGIDESPAMSAQRKKLNSLFGSVIQRMEEEDPLQGIFALVQMKHELGEEEFLPGRFGAVQRVEDGSQSPQLKALPQSSWFAHSPVTAQFYGSPAFSSVVQMLTEEKLIKTKNYGTAYYQYEHDNAGNIDDFSNNRATTFPVGDDPVDNSSLVNLDEGNGTGEGEMRSGKVIDISDGSRSQHFSIADRLIDGTPSDRKGSYTWHHLTPEYYMVLVDMAVHGSFYHKGGKSFWS